MARLRQEAMQREQGLRLEAEVAKAHLETVLAGIQDQFFVLDREWCYTFVNDRVAEVVGKPKEELLGKSIWDVFPDVASSSFYTQIHRAVAQQTVVRFEYFYPTWQRWFENRVYPFAEGVSIFVTDISDRKRAEAEREQLLAREQAAREQAETANRIKDEFLAVLSHELRSPLNPILGWTKLLQSRQFDEQSTKRALETIERNAKLQTQLIEDLLDVSRILRGKMLLNTAPVNLVTTIQAALETVRLSAEAKGIEIQTRFAPEVGKVSGDSARLQQIVWNLLSNAVKFTPSGGQVEIRLERVGTDAQILVKDTGKGINPDFLPYVFEYFRQEDGKTTRKFGGLGLGLAIVRYLTELHGGTVRAESLGEGMGATFTVTLPMLKEESVQIMDQGVSLSLTPYTSPLAGLRILVVDDEPDMQELMLTILEQTEAEVRVSASAAEALTALGSFKPNVLISDIGMPDVDGYMLMRQVRKRSPEEGGKILAIALTAYAGEANEQQTRLAGFQKHIAKPVAPSELIGEISSLIRTLKL
jgi:PAS domain S-box-containing protein